jgi:hypothetical protein
MNPIVDSSIKYFYLGGLSYHGHQITLLYDYDGSRYKVGKGLHVWVDGKKADAERKYNKWLVKIGSPIIKHPGEVAPNVALNVFRKGYPVPTASVNGVPDTAVYQAIDGKTWYFPENNQPVDHIGIHFKRGLVCCRFREAPGNFNAEDLSFD